MIWLWIVLAAVLGALVGGWVVAYYVSKGLRG